MQTKLLYPEEWTQEVKDWAEAARSYNQSRGVSRLPDGAAVAHALQLRSPAPACRYHIDHQYRVILTINYAGATQTAGRALSSAFGFITDSTKCAADPNACDRACAGRSLCLNRTTLEALCPFWKVYTVFGVARNPLVRVVSSWALSNRRFVANSSCAGSFAQFAALPPAYIAPCMRDGGSSSGAPEWLPP